MTRAFKADQRAAAKISSLEIFDLLVVGGGPAGAASAIYAARKGLAVGMVAERFGAQVLDTMLIENFVSVPQREGPSSSSVLEAHVKEYPVEVVKAQRVEKLVSTGRAHGLDFQVARPLAPRRSFLPLGLAGARWEYLERKNTGTGG
ncbi:MULTISPECIES: FAD-dependent oxidoreductase [unclassified Rhizobium]|uniref:FAD-dependent oxidoreductase n=1 Tax=unclassified Rhizobium TaxID=2613769 RepID=UPI001FE0E4EA|nr:MULTISPECIES: FAD-dependent oxidoreductase [unclassified Rhizobium]